MDVEAGSDVRLLSASGRPRRLPQEDRGGPRKATEGQRNRSKRAGESGDLGAATVATSQGAPTEQAACMFEASMVSDINNRKTGQPQGLVFSLCAARVQRGRIDNRHPARQSALRPSLRDSLRDRSRTASETAGRVSGEAEQWADYIAMALDESGSGHNNHNRGDE
jgi:hypothetical protein